MSTIVKNLVQFTGLAIGVPTALPHLINIDGIAKLPRIVAPPDGVTVTADPVNLTVTRQSGGPASADIYCEYWHSCEDAQPPDGISPSLFPIIVGGATSDATPVVDTIDVFNILDYGADPTGVLDFTTPVRNALAAANANVIATGRPTEIFVPAGNFKFLVKTTQRHIDINNMSKLSFVGVDGNRSKFTLQGDAGFGDWYMFNVRGNSSDIEFRKLWLDMDITNPDPGEQNHLIQVGNTGATNVRIIDCTFNRAVGDGIRLAGEFGTPTNEITVRGCIAYNCARAFVSLQRWCQRVTVTDCTMHNGTDQQIDFEPTGYTFTATGGNATTVICATAQFIVWGI